jgi:TPR repeat protein
MGCQGYRLIGFSFLWFGVACSPPNLTGAPLTAPGTADAFGKGKCDAGQPLNDRDLMAWDSTSRAALAAVRRQGIAVVRYEAEGCNAHLELLGSCIAKGKYDFVPYWESKSKLVENEADLYAKLPIGASTLAGELSGDRLLRTDYMLAGLAQTQIGSNFRIEDLVGDCARATHLITRIYLGGFAMVAGEKRSLKASASFFSASSGGQTDASLQQIEHAGDAAACNASHESGKESANCAVPLRIGLLSLEQARPCGEVSECIPRCKTGDAGSCATLGVMYANGNGVPQDLKQGATLLKKACDLGDENGCANLGALYLDGAGVPANPQHAWQLLNGPCQKGISWACGRLGSMYETGYGVRRDLVAATQLYGTACVGGDEVACGRRIPLLKLECDGGQAQDCYELGIIYAKGMGVPTDYPAAFGLLQTACEHGSDDACTEVGTFYIRGLGIAKDAAKGLGVYKGECERGRGGTCAALGIMYMTGEGVAKDYKLAANAFDRGCMDGSPLSCALLGAVYEDGYGVPKDLPKAITLYTETCDSGVAEGCASLAELYEAGKGVKADVARARSLYGQACSSGHEDSCRAAERLNSAQQ